MVIKISRDDFAQQVILIDHQIRINERDLKLAKARRLRSNYSIVFGPLLAIALYGMWWLPDISHTLIKAIYIPALPISIAFCVASYYLKTHPGGPVDKKVSLRSRLLANSGRRRLDEIELELDQLRDTRKSLYTIADVPIETRRSAYKEDARMDVNHYREESNKYRRVNNVLQGVLIVGSLGAAAASGASGDIPSLRWVILAITFGIGVASGFMGYFKYKERSFYLQQTADAIEYEIEAVEIGVGRYKHIQDHRESLEEFAAEVHRLRSEQKKREQNLEQPPDLSNANSQ